MVIPSESFNLPGTIKSNQIFYSSHQLHIVYTCYVCTYSNNCLMWRASREASLIMLLALGYHTCSSPVPDPESGGPPDPSACMATRRPAGHKNTRPASDPATTTPWGRAYLPCRPQIGEIQVRERGTWKENIQKYLYTKHPKNPWPILGKMCAWQCSCDSIYMYTHINPQHYTFVKTTLDIPGSPIESQQCPREKSRTTRRVWS